MSNEKRLIDANVLKKCTCEWCNTHYSDEPCEPSECIEMLRIDGQPTVDAVEVVHGRWVLTANEEHSNYRWNVTAECSECHLSKGEVWAGFFPGFPKELAEDIALESAKSVKMDNYCPNCGASMRDGDGNG